MSETKVNPNENKKNKENKENSDKIIQHYLKKGIKYVAFDWDCTILGIHSCELFNQEKGPSDPKVLFTTWSSSIDLMKPYYHNPPKLEHYANSELFKHVILDCLSNNIAVYIVSFGYRILIKTYVEMLFGPDQTVFGDHNVFTPSMFNQGDFGDMGNKQRMILKIGSPKPSQLLFYDDSRNNISHALIEDYCLGHLVSNEGLGSIQDYLF